MLQAGLTLFASGGSIPAPLAAETAVADAYNIVISYPGGVIVSVAVYPMMVFSPFIIVGLMIVFGSK